jgi:prepilin-type N-terminal cleavage/methylation domain-containing protein
MTRRSRGFTVLELVISITIFAVLSGLVLVSLLTGNRTFATSQALMNVQQDARRALQNMTRELRGAGGTISGWGTNQFDFELGLGYDLTAVAGCAAGQFCWGATDSNGASNGAWKVRYTLIGTQLVRQVLDAASLPQGLSRVLANNVAAVTFVDVGGGQNTVGILLQVVDPNGVTTSPGTLNAQVRLRRP